MKKTIAAGLVLIMVVVCLTGCSVFTNMLDQTANSKPQAQQMMIALTEENQQEAMLLMHLTVDSQEAEAACAQMSAYLDGRKLVSITTTGVNIQSSVGAGGKAEQETAAFRAELEDGTQIEISAIYLEDSEGEGFVSFQLAIGLK